MTVLQALDAYYDRLDARGEVSSPGWSPEKFGWCIIIDAQGEVVDVQDLRDLSGKKPLLKQYRVPASFTRSGVNPHPFFLWDATRFVLGRTAKEEKKVERNHAAFIDFHTERLAGQSDQGLKALFLFLQSWRPERFDQSPFHPDMLDGNVMFRFDGDLCFLHERPAARALIGSPNTGTAAGSAICLVTGRNESVARLHPKIKGVESDNPPAGGGHMLVSFNFPSVTSYGQAQGANAPTSQAAAFRYGTVLNHLLTRDGPNRLRRPVGDATIVFWADAGDAVAEQAADAFFAQFLDSDVSDAEQGVKLREQMEKIAKGRAVADLRPEIVEGTRFHVLGLSPNASRLSVRYWMTDTLDVFARRLARHHQDLVIEPLPQGWGAAPSVNRLLVKTTALQGEFKNIPPLLAGEVMRAILTGGRYPLSLLSATLIRLRAGDPKDKGKELPIGWHAAVIRAVLVRLSRKNPETSEPGETPMSLMKDYANPGYQLGRLFAVYEMAQRAALGRVNATIRDRYFGAASATPASVFPLIVRGGQNHLAKVRKEKPGLATLIERELEEINGRFDPGPGGIWPRSLRLQDQGQFAVGYYHQRATRLSNDKGEAIDIDELAETTSEEGTEA